METIDFEYVKGCKEGKFRWCSRFLRKLGKMGNCVAGPFK